MRRFLLFATALFLLVTIGLPCAALYSVLYTQSGLRFVVRHLPRRFGHVGVRIEDVSGTIAGGARAGLVVIDQERVHLEFRGIYTRTRLEPLLWQIIRTPETTVDSAYIRVKRPPPGPPGPHRPPEFLPRWLTIDIGHASVGKAVLVVPDGARLEGSGIAGSALLQHRDIRFYRATLQMAEVHFAISSGALHAGDPLRLTGKGRITWQPRGQPVWTVAAQGAGDLDRLGVSARILTPFQSDLSGEMLDLTHDWHWEGEAAVRNFDLRAWHLTGALGAIRGKLDLSGAGKTFAAHGTLDPAGLKAGPFDVQFDGGYSDKVLTARRIDILHPASGARTIASGTIGSV